MSYIAYAKFSIGVCYDIESILYNSFVVPLYPDSLFCNDSRIHHTIDIGILVIMRTGISSKISLSDVVSFAALPYDSFILLLTFHQLVLALYLLCELLSFL